MFRPLFPDAKWIAYESDESGRSEVYVQSAPASGAKYQVSTAGGTMPAWRRDGKELYYLSPDQKLMAVAIKSGSRSKPAHRRAPLPCVGISVSFQLATASDFW